MQENESRQQEQLFALHQDEYSSLKAEQASRIGFRDNLLYVTLGVVGGVCAYAVKKPEYATALLLIPWACFILGWTYLMNDRAISAIGRYIRTGLTAQLEQDCGVPKGLPFRWENEHRDDDHRVSRKILQLIVDLIAFCCSGFVALIAFFLLAGHVSWAALFLCVCDGVMLLVLAVQIILYAEVFK
ncbi:MAG: hypothetical protein Q3M30_07820 [Candidatus Electrothrix sp. Rat3]|nr:hypothetical protein [Candidatus Electrothrix rattekaaiensis]